MMTLRQIFQWGRSALEETTKQPAHEMHLLIEKYLNKTKKDLILNPEVLIDETQEKRLKKAIDERRAGKPLQYILGEWEFMGLTFDVSPAVLIPRPETEHLVESVLETVTTQATVRCLDLGTGSGAIAVSLAYFLDCSEITAVDISTKALAVAKKNAKRQGVADRISFIESDLYENISSDEGFDCIVSNPPYIPEDNRVMLQREIREHEPAIALFGGKDGYDCYRRIIEKAPDYLKPGGFLFLEAGDNQAEQLAEWMRTFFEEIKIIKDLQGLNRVVQGKLK